MKRVILGLVVMLSSSASIVNADPSAPAMPAAGGPPAAAASMAIEPIAYEKETLPNGLRVIYAPMDNAPVIHLRVLYHVGSRDEAPDRQGFAHMFEHMMFRGSANVKSEEHMKLIQGVGGTSNAFTSFDQTTYINTVPNNHLEMAVWLEADRMASFRVSQPVLETERQVVKEEWRLRYANQPYGPMNADLFGLAFTTHNYRWPTIGDMDQLAQSMPQELQDFHDRYYVPNNACLVIAGEFDIAKAREWVKQYFGWIPKGDEIARVTRPEPEQTAAREKIVYKEGVPITAVSMLFKSPAYRETDHLAIEMFCNILGSGRSSRLYKALVATDPVAAGVQMGNYQLEDPSAIICSTRVLPGKDAGEAIARIKAEFAKFIADGITQEELDKARTQVRIQLIQQRSTAESIASALGEEEVFGGDAARVNELFPLLEKLTTDDVKDAAAKYLTEKTLSVVQYRPAEQKPADADGKPAAGEKLPATTQQSSLDSRATLAAMKRDDASAATTPPTTQPTTQPVAPPVVSKRNHTFPAGYPTRPPVNNDSLSAEFEKGVVSSVNGTQLITLSDYRLPVVSVTMVLRGGSHAVPAEKEGVASLMAAMLTRGAADMNAAQLAEDLESRAISISASDDGDVTRLTAFATIDQLDHALLRLKQVALQPTFPANEFEKLKRQSFTGLMQGLSNPGDVADRKLDELVFGSSPLGKNVTLESLQGVTVDDAKAYYTSTFKPENAILVFAGAIDQARAQTLAGTLLAGWQTGAPPAADYNLPPVPEKRQIVLVDNPNGKQAVVRLGIQTYSLKDDSRFAGSIAGQILSSGIDSRLNIELRAKRGLTYGSYGYFRPSRNGGSFELSVETRPTAVDEAITAAIEVLEKMRKDDVTGDELSEAKRRVAGVMVLETQTIQQQAGRRVDTVLNGWPEDYYDKYAKRIAQVEASEVRGVMNQFVKPGQMSIVVVAPAAEVKDQLAKLGEVTVVEMPLAKMQGMMGGMPAAK